MSKIFYVEADSLDKIKQGYYDAVQGGYTHFRARGKNGYYGWNIFTNEHIAIALDGSECQEIWRDISAPKIILIKEVNKVIEPIILPQEDISLPLIIGGVDLASEDTMYKEQIENLESLTAALETEIMALKSTIEELQSNANAPLSIEELLKKEVALPPGIIIEIEIKKTITVKN